MGANTVIHAARNLPWLRGIVALTPFDPICLIRIGAETQLRELLEQASVLHCEGSGAIFQDMVCLAAAAH